MLNFAPLNRFLVPLFLSLHFFSPLSLAEKYNVPNDDKYYLYESGPYNFIYTANERPLLNDLLHFNEAIRQTYENDFNWKFDQRATVFLLSNRNQIDNGLATPLPQLETVFYPGGAEWPDEFSSNSWLYILLSHETSHLYQLNPKRGYGEWLHKITHNADLSAASVFPPFTYTEYPNVFLPTFLLEGNAVFNECRSGNGGRLYNGAIRATFLQLARAGKVNSKRLMNDHIDYPGTSEKYWVGGYLQLSLAESFGLDKVDKYFYSHADNYINPFKVNAAFIETFGVGYEGAISELNKKWQPLYSTITTSKEPVLFHSRDHGWLSKDTHEIRALANDGVSDPVAHIYDLNTNEWQTSRLQLPMGRLFRMPGGELVATGAGEVDNQNILAGLFYPGSGYDQTRLNRYYYDIQGHHELYADARNSFKEPSLVADGRPMGPANSSAIFGPDGEPYYFRQIGKDHTLYHNGKPLFSYKGFYGFPVEVSESGDVYFIGPVERGASLFVFHSGEFKRLNASDVIVDAKLINSENAVVVEATDSGFEYKTIGLKAHTEKPFEYSYFFEKEEFNKTFQSDDKTIPQRFDSAQEHEYHSLKAVQFDGIDPMLLMSSQQGVVGSIGLRASDPLQNHSFNLALASSDYNTGGVQFSYTNQQYAAAWQVLGSYQRIADFSGTKDSTGLLTVDDKYNSWVATTGFNYPFYVKRNLRATLIPYFVYQYDDPHIQISNTAQTFSFLTRIMFDNTVTAPLAYSSIKHFNLELAHDRAHDAPTWQNGRNIFAGQLTAQYDVYHMTYLSAAIQDALTDGTIATVHLRQGLDKFPLPTSTIVYRLTPYLDQLFYEARRTTVQLKQGFNIGYYFTKFPLSARRFAVFSAYNQYSGALAAHESPRSLFDETVFGGEVEFLLLHKFPFRLAALSAKSSFTKTSQTVVTIGAATMW